MNPKTIKISILALLTGIFSFFSFYLLNQGMVLGSLGSVWPLLIAFLLFIVFIVLEAVFIKDLYLLVSLVFLQSIISLLVFMNSFHSLNFFLLGFAVLFLFIIWGVKKAHSNIRDGLKANFFSAARRVVPKLVTGILLFMVVVLYFNYIALGNFDENTGRRVFDKIAVSLTPILEIWIPDVSLDMKVGEMLEKMAETQLQKSKIELLKKDINLEELSPSQKEKLVNQTAIQIEAQIEEVVGQVDSDQTIRSFAYTLIKEKIEALSPAAKKLIGGVVLLLLFFAAKGMAFFVCPVIEFIAFVVYQILLMAGFAYISLETRQKEIINLS